MELFAFFPIDDINCGFKVTNCIYPPNYKFHNKRKLFAILQKTDIYELRYIIWKYLHKYKCGDGNIGLGIIGCQNETVLVHYCIQRKNQLSQKLFLCKNCGHKLVFC
jgi:hypothetical protein